MMESLTSFPCLGSDRVCFDSGPRPSRWIRQLRRNNLVSPRPSQGIVGKHAQENLKEKGKAKGLRNPSKQH